jgi:DNA-binding NarL/FixJ family response regulator
VLLVEGDSQRALVELRSAFAELHDLGMRYDAARARLLLADACAALGDHDTARLESRSAREELESLGATTHSTVPTRGGTLPEGLTARELDVLVLVARGKTNRAIGRELYISEKTVASHVSHIFTKLGVASRSAATAYAYDHDLV